MVAPSEPGPPPPAFHHACTPERWAHRVLSGSAGTVERGAEPSGHPWPQVGRAVLPDRAYVVDQGERRGRASVPETRPLTCYFADLLRWVWDLNPR